MDAYQVLGLRQGATEEEVKTAYRTLAQKYQPENYEAGPLREDAEHRMEELNAAFDEIMGQLRTGAASTTAGSGYTQNSTQSQYADIRQMINNGNVDEALARLNAISGGQQNAEWNFLVGSAYYYKGWLNDALQYFQTASQLDPSNREYEAALRNLQNSAGGGMYGNPYAAQGGYPRAAAGCSCCDVCTAMMCMDLCCGCGRGGC